DRRRDLLVEEAQRHLDVDLLRGKDALEVDVQHLRLEGMPLRVAQQDLLGLAVDLEVENARVEGLVAHGVVQRVVVELDGHGFTGPAVEDARRTAGAPQAAARTRTLQRSRRCYDFHVSTPDLPGPRPAPA